MRLKYYFGSFLYPLNIILGSGFRESATSSKDPSIEHRGQANDFPRPNVVNVPELSHEISVPSQSPSRSLTPLDHRQPSPSSQYGLLPSQAKELPVISPSTITNELGLSPASSSSGLLSPSTPPPSHPIMFPSAKPSLTSFHKGR